MMSVIYYLIDTLLPFEWTEFSYMKNALLAILLITPLFGLVGTMIVNNKMSFFSDALGHSALTGIAIGVLMGVDNYLFSMLGFALLFALCISAVMNSGTSSADTIIGVFSSTGLALGIVLLSASGGFAKYSGYLIGDILTVQPAEIAMLVEEELLPYAEVVDVTVDASGVCRDPQDDKFLALAASGKAAFIITGDQDLLVLQSFRKIRIVTVRAFEGITAGGA